jgi:50S ribosomal subunit-associated GTPase HflX
MSGLTASLSALLEGSVADYTITFGQDDYEIISRIHDDGEVLEQRYEGERVILRFRMNRIRAEHILASFRKKQERKRETPTRAARTRAGRPRRKG